MKHEADVLKLGRDIDVKVFDGDIMHHFFIQGDGVEYAIAKDSGRDLIAIASAKLQDMRDDRILIRTASHLFEVVPVPGPNGNWQAYKSTRK